MRDRATSLFRERQQEIVSALEQLDGQARFETEDWIRPDAGGGHGGGGTTRVLRRGAVFEQAGVNFSEVYGTLPSEMSLKLIGVDAPQPFYATGVSLVLHPLSPMIPTTHANFRYLEVGEKSWFGGGADLTPYYLYSDDAIHFHRTLKTVCDSYDSSYYARFKKECDSYFYLPHRQETRGVGGLFFDYMAREDSEQLNDAYRFASDLSRSFVPSYVPIAERRREEPWGDKEREFQLIRRGRYVEFNLLYDRGTHFGLKTGGRTESILMSLPPMVRWEYNYEPEVGSREAEILAVVRSPREWV